MNRRDEFAKSAMNGLLMGLVAGSDLGDNDRNVIVRRSYEIADAMLAASGEKAPVLPEVTGDEYVKCRTYHDEGVSIDETGYLRCSPHGVGLDPPELLKLAAICLLRARQMGEK